jgi:2-keto-4-pentenoate hydratase/2-oxohepta-3-ene-1,7-dioic acid hydratase in catechol pathway
MASGFEVRGSILRAMGPYITTRDEIADVQSLKIEGRLNGQTMQSSNTSFL